MSTVVGRAAAFLAVCSAVLHAVSLTAAENPWISVLTMVMAAGCGYCAYELWRFDTMRSWMLVAVMNLAMIGIHLPMSGGHHHGVGTGAAMTAAMGPAMQLATVMAVVEVFVASTVLYVRSRGVAPD